MTRALESSLLALAALAAATASVIFYSSFSLNHDSSWYLVATRAFLDGGTLYQDIIEINPPLAFYLTAPALIASDLFAIRPATAYFLYVSVIGGISLIWVHRICCKTALESVPRLLIVGCAFVGCFLIPMQDFGQREHLLLTFALPYFCFLIFHDGRPAVSWKEQSALGLFAFFGLGLKPYFLLIPTGIVAFRFLCRRDLSEIFNAANWALGLALLLYVAFIVYWHPLYLEVIVPEAALVYEAYGRGALGVFLKLEIIGCAAVTLLAVACFKQLDRPAIAILGGLLGAALSYLIQFKGWGYHLIPLAFFVLLGVVWITYCGRSQIRDNVLLGVTALLAVLLTLLPAALAGPYVASTTTPFATFVKRDGTPILVLSSNVYAAFPFINEVDANWTSRYPTQWLLPGAISRLQKTNCANQSQLCDDLRRIVSATRTKMIEDFKKGQPELVFIDDRKVKSYFGETPFDYKEFLLQESSFVEVWSQYEKIGQAGDYEVWAISKPTI